MIQEIGAIYARTSKDTDDAYSVSSQVDAGIKYAADRGITVPENYVFREDFTGKAFDRPEYSKIRTLIQSHSITCLIIFATDRLARKVSVGELYLDEMIENAVVLHNCSWGQAIRNTPEDKLRFNFETTFSSFERDKIIERTMRGKVTMAQKGMLVAHARPLYGYSINEYKNNVVLNPCAIIVKEVLETYADQVNPNRIADSLNARQFPTPGIIKGNDFEAVAEKKFKAGRITQEQYNHFVAYANKCRGYGEWSTYVIHTILKNADRYYGDYTFTLKGITYHVDAPPIISVETAEAVKRMLNIGKRRFARRENGGELGPYLLARRLTCALDGFSIGVKLFDPPYRSWESRHYYFCTGRRTGRVECINKPIRNDVLDPIAINFIRQLLTHPDLLFQWWEEQHRKDEDANQKIVEKIAQIDSRLVELQNKLYRTLDKLTDRLDAEEQLYYSQQRDSLKKMISDYKESKAEFERSLIVTDVDQEVVQSFAEMGQEYQDELYSNTDPAFWRGLVDDLDLSGEIGTDENGQYIEFIILNNVREKRYIPDTDSAGSSMSIIYYSFKYYLSGLINSLPMLNSPVRVGV